MTMKKLLTFISLSFLISCCKEKSNECATPPICDCQELGEGPLNGWTYLIDSNYYMYPCFNPNNSDEIIFTKKNNATDVTKLYKYNLQTHEKSLIHEGYQIFPPSWGKNDWILLNLYGRSVWKIKSDGTELTQLTNTFNDLYPIWRSDCSIFSAHRGAFTDILQKTILYTPDGIPFDTLQNTGLGSNSDWREDGLSCSMGDYGPRVSDISNDVVVFFDSAQYSGSGGSTWLNVNEFIWSYEKGIYKTNYLTGVKNLIKPTCRTRLYFDPTYSSNVNKIIWARVDLKQLNDFEIEVKSRLFMMNPDGSDETEIIIE
ncbi:MAG: hypothetical protein RLZZ155_633 [Bacteroidota bacterium]